MSGRSRVWQKSAGRWNGAEPPVLLTHQPPVFFMHHAVMRPAEHRQVGQRRLAAAGPPDQVMPVAPTQWSRAAREDTVPVPCLERPPGRRRQGPARVTELVLELALAGLGGHRASTLELAGRRALDAGERVEAGADDQLRPRAGAVAFAACALSAEFDQGVGVALTVAAWVVLHRLHEGLQRRSQRRATLGIEHAIEPHEPVLRLTHMEIA